MIQVTITLHDHSQNKNRFHNSPIIAFCFFPRAVTIISKIIFEYIFHLSHAILIVFSGSIIIFKYKCTNCKCCCSGAIHIPLIIMMNSRKTETIFQIVHRSIHFFSYFGILITRVNTGIRNYIICNCTLYEKLTRMYYLYANCLKESPVKSCFYFFQNVKKGIYHQVQKTFSQHCIMLFSVYHVHSSSIHYLDSNFCWAIFVWIILRMTGHDFNYIAPFIQKCYLQISRIRKWLTIT